MASTYGKSNVWMIDHMEHYLKNNLHATAEEIDYLKQLCGLKSQKSETSPNLYGRRKPSVVIDNFLYHGNVEHARSVKLLNELGIQNIINVCDIEPEKEISEQFNVLWINIDDTLNAGISPHFDKTNRFLQMCKQNGEKVLVHCVMGISRSSSIVLAYLIK
jgi:hypothetical protein